MSSFDLSSSRYPLTSTLASELDLDGRPPRVVIDTAVVVSALVFGGETSTRLRRAWRHGFCRPMVCAQTLLDLFNTLGQPRFGFTEQEQRRMLGEYLPFVLKVRVPDAVPPSAPVNALGQTLPQLAQPQPGSMAFVQLAMAGQAHLLVTADEPMLTLAGTTSLPFQIVALEPFLNLLRQSAIDPKPLRQRR